MSLMAPEYALVHLITAAVAGFILGRLTAGAGSPEARAAVSRQARDSKLSTQQNLDRLPVNVRTAIEALLAEGRIIEAVRDVRGALGLGLKEAKDVVDLMREQPRSGGARLH